MLLQANETNAATSIPANTIRNFDPASPAPGPYKPVPSMNIGLGIVTGMFLSVAIAFLVEKMDNSVRLPGHSRRLLNVPELGVIPSVEAVPARAGWRRFARLSGNGNRPPEVEPASVLSFPRSGTEAWQGAPEVAESSRIVCATDAGREGELIFRYIYEAAQCDKPFSRLWISSLTPDAIRKGFDSLRPGRDYDPLANAARGRILELDVRLFERNRSVRSLQIDWIGGA
jgi:hypothetical protein